MSIIVKQDSNGVKPLLQVGELGYDNFPAGGDEGRVWVGTGTANIAQAKKSEVTAVDSKVDTHIAKEDNPHGVTKAQVGLGNADNTADVDKNVLSATKLTTARTITLSGDVVGSVSFDGTTNLSVSTTIQPNSVSTVAIAPVGTAGTYTKVTTNAKGQVITGTVLSASDIPGLDASKITSGVIDIARLPASGGSIPEYATLSQFPIVGESGKVYIALDTNKLYRWSGSTYVSIAGAVDSVAGKTGAVSLVKGDVGLADVDNTSDINKPISTATQTALNTKVDITTNQTISGVKTFSASPIVPTATTATQAVNKGQLDLKAPLASPTFTGTPKIGIDNITSISTSVTDNAIARYDGTTGKLQNSNVTIDDDSNVGVNIPISNWNSIISAVDIGNNATISGRNSLVVGSNFYVEGTSYTNSSKYKGSGAAGRIDMGQGCAWYFAPYGTAGDTITWTRQMLLDANGNLLLTSETGALGYGAGAGGVVTQLTSKSTTVTLNKPTGRITMHNAALAAGDSVAFVLLNSLIASNDITATVCLTGGVSNVRNYIVDLLSTSGALTLRVTNISSGSLSEAVVLHYTIIKGVTA